MAPKKTVAAGKAFVPPRQTLAALADAPNGHRKPPKKARPGGKENTGARSTPRAVVLRFSRQTALASDEEDEEGSDEEEAPEAEEPIHKATKWALYGALAGAKARDDAAAGREYSVLAPQAVLSAGEAAEDEYMAAFAESFKPRLNPMQDAVVSGLVAHKKRRKSAIVLNKDGLAGLKENASTVLASVTYAHARANYFMADDDGYEVVCAALRADGFNCTDDEYEEWWALIGHKQARSKAKSARYRIGEALKDALWSKHGALRMCVSVALRANAT